MQASDAMRVRSDADMLSFSVSVGSACAFCVVVSLAPSAIRLESVVLPLFIVAIGLRSSIDGGFLSDDFDVKWRGGRRDGECSARNFGSS